MKNDRVNVFALHLLLRCHGGVRGERRESRHTDLGGVVRQFGTERVGITLVLKSRDTEVDETSRSLCLRNCCDTGRHGTDVGITSDANVRVVITGAKSLVLGTIGGTTDCSDVELLGVECVSSAPWVQRLKGLLCFLSLYQSLPT